MNFETGYAIAIVGFFMTAVVWAVKWKKETEKRFSELKKVAQDIYMLSNSHMAEQLRLNVKVTKRLADLTGNAEDVEEASISKDRYEQHLRRQDKVAMEEEGR